MRKTYRYKNLQFPVQDETEVTFEVEFISDGNTGQTVVNVPGPNDKELENSDKKVIGKGKELRDGFTICFSDIANLVPEEDEIKINYKINDTTIVQHVNQKTEEERPIIVLAIKFPQP
ncbi:hypothetical protein ABWH96_00835 [Marivirga tractuosa]|uniref:hypothetical protein n=1 Tax=Marivirga tractuosa TaxID=1006 RepID=UPI0035D0C1DD